MIRQMPFSAGYARHVEVTTNGLVVSVSAETNISEGMPTVKFKIAVFYSGQSVLAVESVPLRLGTIDVEKKALDMYSFSINRKKVSVEFSKQSVEGRFGPEPRYIYLRIE